MKLSLLIVIAMFCVKNTNSIHLHKGLTGKSYANVSYSEFENENQYEFAQLINMKIIKFPSHD